MLKAKSFYRCHSACPPQLSKDSDGWKLADTTSLFAELRSTGGRLVLRSFMRNRERPDKRRMELTGIEPVAS